MKVNRIPLSCALAFFVVFSSQHIEACSMYKITADGKTMVGCNEDAWRTTPRIWFANANNENEYGATFTGSRPVSSSEFSPQSGMNESGLVFSRLTSYHPKQSEGENDKKKIKNESFYLSDILHKCASVEEVSAYVEQFDRSTFVDDVFIYVDSSGTYLVVEPYRTITGDGAHYVLSNFCPSITDRKQARKLERYRKGEDFIDMHKLASSLSYCTSLSDTMHVCRNRNGDGTLLTSIWDTKNGSVNLFFYHNYDTSIQFNLVAELSKGNHILDLAVLFSSNPEFERLANYVTPFNKPALRVLLVILGGFLTVSSLLFGTIFFRMSNSVNTQFIWLLFAALNLLITFYFYVLATNINIYYFDAPYKHHRSDLISWSAYTPFLMLFSMIPLTICALRFYRTQRMNFWKFSLLLANGLVYLVAIFGCKYWGLFNVLG